MSAAVEIQPDWRPGCSLDVLRKRAWMLAQIRSYFSGRGVMEVETPNLCHTIGTDPYLDYFRARSGREQAVANPVYFLQTSPEFCMKRLLAAGSGSIYQICKAYRNGESGRFHNPEFTILEWYRVDFDLDDLIAEVDELLGPVLGLFPLEKKSERIDYQQAFIRHCGLDPLGADVEDFKNLARSLGDTDAFALCGTEMRLWQEYLFGCYVQPRLGESELCFVYDYPVEQCALARLKPGNPRLAERIEVFFRGVELANGFRELRCESEQRARFRHDLEIRRQNGKDLPRVDERFLGALKAGLPDCSGIAIGLDRVLMLLVSASSIDEVLSFSMSRA